MINEAPTRSYQTLGSVNVPTLEARSCFSLTMKKSREGPCIAKNPPQGSGLLEPGLDRDGDAHDDQRHRAVVSHADTDLVKVLDMFLGDFAPQRQGRAAGLLKARKLKSRLVVGPGLVVDL